MTQHAKVQYEWNQPFGQNKHSLYPSPNQFTCPNFLLELSKELARSYLQTSFYVSQICPKTRLNSNSKTLSNFLTIGLILTHKHSQFQVRGSQQNSKVPLIATKLTSILTKRNNKRNKEYHVVNKSLGIHYSSFPFLSCARTIFNFSQFLLVSPNFI